MDEEKDRGDQEAEQWLCKHWEDLARLSRSRAVIDGNLAESLHELCMTAAQGLQGDRVTIWVYNEDYTKVDCVAEFVGGKTVDCGNKVLSCATFPHYLSAMQTNRVCAVSDTEREPPGFEFASGTPPEPTIRAFLAATFAVRGRKTGIVRVDHLSGPRAWRKFDELYLASLADIIALTLEIAERVRAEEKLRQSEEKLRLILETAREFAFLLMDKSGIVLECNTGAELMLGYKEWELIGQSGDCIFTEEDRRAGAPEREMGHARERGRSIDERWHRRKDGSKFWASGFLYALRSQKGELTGFVKILRDITDRKLGEDRLASENDLLEKQVAERTSDYKRAAEQLEAFCYTIAHDLRAPLRSMNSFSAILIADYSQELGQEGADLLLRIKASADRMDSLIKDLLEYSRIGRVEVRAEIVDMSVVVAAAIEDVRGEIEAKHARVLVQPALPSVYGNQPTLQHVVLNLLTNALKFTPPGQHPEVKIFAEGAPPFVRFVVQDNGIGIAEEHNERIFRIFERLHGTVAFPGTGVGLAIVRKAVESLGGRTGVKSEVGKGSSFWFELRAPED